MKVIKAHYFDLALSLLFIIGSLLVMWVLVMELKAVIGLDDFSNPNCIVFIILGSFMMLLYIKVLIKFLCGDGARYYTETQIPAVQLPLTEYNNLAILVVNNNATILSKTQLKNYKTLVKFEKSLNVITYYNKNKKIINRYYKLD